MPTAIKFIILASLALGALPQSMASPKGQTCKSALTDAEIEAEFSKPYQGLLDADQATLNLLQERPVETYLNLRASGSNNGLKTADFPFPPHKPIIERIIKDLEQRLERKFGQKYKAELETALAKANALNKNYAPPYEETVRFILAEYLPALDLILFERHPKLKGNNFHQRNAGRLVDQLLDKSPDLFFYFSFLWVDDEFFVDTRPALMNLIGINLTGLDDSSEPPFADKFPMSLTEFAFHDIGHAEFTSGRDIEYLESDTKPIERVAWEWESTRLRIKEVVDQTRPSDAELADSMNHLLFELLRERGFQFSLTVLKQELETPKWTEVLQKKYRMGFYDYYGIEEHKFTRLEEARLSLVQAVERFKEEDQISWLTATKGTHVPVSISHTAQLVYAKGGLREVEITASGAMVHLTTQANSKVSTSIRELVSAQVDPIKESPFGKLLNIKIRRALSLDSVESVILKPNHSFWVKSSGGSLSSLDDFYIPLGTAQTKVLDDIEIFEINQVLGTDQRKELQVFTLRQPPRNFIGTLNTEQDLVTGRYTALIKTTDGEEHKFPLVELRVDPL